MSKLPALAAVSVPALDDLLYLVDVSDTTDDPTGSSRDITIERLLAVGLHGICQGRLTTESGVPVSTSDRVSQGTLFFTPQDGNRIALYDGTRWGLFAFTERSLALSGLTSGRNYDVFLFNNAGTLTLELSAAWTNDTTRAEALTTQDGILVKSGALTRRYLGTVRTTGTTTIEDSAKNRFVWNHYNRVPRYAVALDALDHTYPTNTERDWGNDTDTQCSMVLGILDEILEFLLFARVGTSSGTTTNAVVYERINGTTNTDYIFQGFIASATAIGATGALSILGGRLGLNTLIARQNTFGGTPTYHECTTQIGFQG